MIVQSTVEDRDSSVSSRLRSRSHPRSCLKPSLWQSQSQQSLPQPQLQPLPVVSLALISSRTLVLNLNQTLNPTLCRCCCKRRIHNFSLISIKPHSRGEQFPVSGSSCSQPLSYLCERQSHLKHLSIAAGRYIRQQTE
jgi:hypothetical protein